MCRITKLAGRLEKYEMHKIEHDYLCGQESKSKKNTKNGCHLKTTSQNHYIFDVHMWGIYVHMYTKYEVSMSTLCQGEVCTDNNANANDDDAQFMIV